MASVGSSLTGEGGYATVAVSGDELLGYVVTRRTDRSVDLQRIGVHPSYRRKGFARGLLDVAVEQATAGGADQMLLEVGVGNEPALAFYAVAGFVAIDRRSHYFRDDSDALVLRRPLSPA